MKPLADRPYAGVRIVTPDYFQAMSIRHLKGRLFTDEDRDNTPNVTIVNEAPASRYWPHQNAIGKRLSFEEDPGKQVWLEIVGVVGNVKHKALEIEVMPEVYIPYRQDPSDFMSLVVRKGHGSGDHRNGDWTLSIACIHSAHEEFVVWRDSN